MTTAKLSKIKHFPLEIMNQDQFNGIMIEISNGDIFVSHMDELVLLRVLNFVDTKYEIVSI